MEQDVETGYSTLCSTCLCSNRDLYKINNTLEVFQIFRLLMYDFAGDRFGDTFLDMEQLICWECLALMKRFLRFKWQVHSAQEHLRVLALSRTQDSFDHNYMSQSLSTLEVTVKKDYDNIYFYYSSEIDDQQYIPISSIQEVKNEHYDVLATMQNNLSMTLDDHMLEVPGLVLENREKGVMSHIMVGSESIVTGPDCKPGQTTTIPLITITSVATQMNPITAETNLVQGKQPKLEIKQEDPSKCKYTVETMTEEEMLERREELKQKVQYASSVYKCELCVVGFYTQQQVEDHFEQAHRVEKMDYSACKVCYMFIEDSKLSAHENSHYLRYLCKLCGHKEYGARLIEQHIARHMARPAPGAGTLLVISLK